MEGVVRHVIVWVERAELPGADHVLVPALHRVLSVEDQAQSLCPLPFCIQGREERRTKYQL